MFGRHKVLVPPGFEAVVNHHIERTRPLVVGWRDQVHFVSFLPTVLPLSTKATCRDGVEFQAAASVRLRISRDVQLPVLLAESGHSSYQDTVKITPDDIAKRQRLQASAEAAVVGFLRARGFFELRDQGAASTSLSDQIQGVCGSCLLEGELLSLELIPQTPSDDTLAQLNALSAENSELAAVVAHFERTSRFLELRRAVAGEREETLKARADLQIAKASQDERVAAEQAEQEKKAAQRRREAQERNAEVKEHNAAFEFAYKTKRLDEEKALAAKALELAEAKQAERELDRRQRQLELELEIQKEQMLADIRARQQVRVLEAVGAVVEKLGQIRPPDYSSVRTLVGGAAESRDQITGPLTGILTALLDRIVDDSAGSPGIPKGRDRKP